MEARRPLFPSMRWIGSALVLLFGCAPAWDGEVARPGVTDLDPDPRVIEIDLVAQPTTLEVRPGRASAVYGYDGLVPGPHIEANVGDRLIVHFRNELPEETTIHWHGVRVPNAMDGVPGHTQAPVPPGGTFEYAFELPDEGLYWFHPHSRSAAQVAAGLYGTILVRAPDEPEVPELVLVLSDIAVDEEGVLLPPDIGGPLASVFGREGDIILVNGRVHPTVHVRPGQTVRLRIVNAAISRYMNLRLDRTRFRVVGGDRGLNPRAEMVDTLLVLPGQRVDAVVTLTRSGVVPLSWVPFDRGFGSTEFREPEPILSFSVEGLGVTAEPVVFPSREITPIDRTGATLIEANIVLGTLDGHDAFRFDGVPGWPDAPLPAAVGETQVFHFTNTSSWSHPIHLHGFFFQEVIDGRTDGIWRDTIDVPHGGEATFAVTYEDRPGMWMFHCHILDHHELGMMGMIDLGGVGHMH
jgi:FtsP/CotA-like multicopper oxidase with cupredoxin domain